MRLRASLAAVALLLAGACREATRAVVQPATATSPRAAPAGPPDEGTSERAAPPGRRGDRHARAAARQPRALRQVVGTIVRVEEGRVVIRRRDGGELTLRIGPRTRLAAPGRPTGRAALAPGDEVRASWRGGGGEPPTALSVKVEHPVRGAPPAPPEPAGTDRG